MTTTDPCANCAELDKRIPLPTVARYRTSHASRGDAWHGHRLTAPAQPDFLAELEAVAVVPQ